MAALSNDDLVVRINSGGGNLFEALAIFNILQRHGNAMIDVEGAALSAAAVIAMAGRRIRMAGGALLMIHSPMHLVGGTISDHESSIEMLKRGEQSTIDIFERRTRLPRQRIADMLTNETWMSAQEAIQLGFADELITAAERIAASVGDLQSHWDRAVAAQPHRTATSTAVACDASSGPQRSGATISAAACRVRCRFQQKASKGLKMTTETKTKTRETGRDPTSR